MVRKKKKKFLWFEKTKKKKKKPSLFPNYIVTTLFCVYNY